MAEIPCHAVKSPFEAALQPGDPQGNLRPEPWPEPPHVTPVGAAKRKSLQREDNIFSWKLSKRQQKRAAACARPAPGLPTGLSAPSAQAARPKPRQAHSIFQRQPVNSY